MRGDHLSELCDLVEIANLITGGIVARGGWRSQSPITEPIKFFAVVDGHATLHADDVDGPSPSRRATSRS